MQGKLHQYKIIKDLAKKYSHSTYLAAPTDESERQVVLIAFTASLFTFSYEHEAVLEKAQSLKRLQHPHLVPILDMGIADEQPFIVRDYLPYQSLRSRLKQLTPQRLELLDALTIVLQVGEALAYAHTHNIFHGNIKPENILLDAHGHALLTDFMLIHRADAIIRDQTTEEYAFCYQAPEQFTGTCDAYSDQYALGCLTYELITGQVPFVTQTLASMLGSYSYVQPARPSEKVPDLLPSLDSAVLKTLVKDPSERFFDLSLFLEVIRSIVSPPPAFPLLRSAAAYKQRNISRMAQLPKAHAVLASSHKHTTLANPLPQMQEASSAFSPIESNTTENSSLSAIDAIFLADQAEGAFTSEVFGNDAMTIALPKHIDLDTPQTRQARRGRRKKLLSLLLLCLFIVAIGSYAAFSLLGADKANQAINSAPLVPRVGIPAATSLAGTQVTVSVSSRTTLQSTLPANIKQQTDPAPQANTTPQANSAPQANTTPQINITPQANPVPQITPAPTPTPVPVARQTTTIDDSVQGTGNNQFNYVGGGWKHISNWCQGNPCEYNKSNSWDTSINDYMNFTFTGTQLRFYGVIDTSHGIGAVSMDGGDETMIDYYATSRKGNQLLWTSPMLPAGTHTFKLRVTGNKNASSTNSTITVDRVDILS